MEIISSLENKKIKNLSKLLQKKYRDEENKFLVCGEHLVEEAAKNNLLLEIIKCEDCNLNFNVPITLVTYEVIKKLTNLQTPQKIVGVVKKISSSEIGNRLLLIDDLQDPGNLGTIIRSCVAFNIDTIILSPNTVDLYNEKVIRATQGLIFSINIIKKDLKSTITDLKKEDYQIYGTSVIKGENIKNVKPSSKYAIIVGNEGQGVKEELLELCNKYLYIPMHETCESLNVSIATSIILYEFSK